MHRDLFDPGGHKAATEGVGLSAQIVFFVASRGHHADVGGITPGSMPPTSRRLVEEGAAIVSFKLVRDGAFQARAVKSDPDPDPAEHFDRSRTAPRRAAARSSVRVSCRYA